MSHKIVCEDTTIQVDLGKLEQESPVIKEALENNQPIILPFGSDALQFLLNYSGLKGWKEKCLAVRLADFLCWKGLVEKFIWEVTSYRNGKHQIRISSPFEVGLKPNRSLRLSEDFDNPLFKLTLNEIPISEILKLGKVLIYQICSYLTITEAKSLLERLDKELNSEVKLVEEMRELWDVPFVIKNSNSLDENRILKFENCGILLIEMFFLNPELFEQVKKRIDDMDEDDRFNWQLDSKIRDLIEYLLHLEGNFNEEYKIEKVFCPWTIERFQNKSMYDFLIENEWFLRLYLTVDKDENRSSSFLKCKLLLELSRLSVTWLKKLIDEGYGKIVTEIIFNTDEEWLNDYVEEFTRE